MLKKELKKFFAPEFLNRIDEVIIFNSLGKDEIKQIVKLELDKLSKRLEGLHYNIKFDDSILDMLSDVGFNSEFGARPVSRAIQDKIEDFISEEVLNGKIVEGEEYTLVSKDNEVKFKPKRKRRTKKEDK